MIVRAREIKQLESMFEGNSNSIILMSGRNPSEKEGIFKLFLKNKKHFYYRARNASPLEQYNQMKAQIEKKYNEKLTRGTYAEAFNRVKSGDASKLVVVIDEVSRFKKDNEEFWKAMLDLRAKKLYPGPVMIILYTSSLVWASEGAADTMGELYKKLDAKIKLENLKFTDVVKYFDKLSVTDTVKLYATLGGCPDYLNRYNPNQDYKTNVCRLILNSYGSLNGEAERFIGTELRELSVYDTILASIASGNRKLNDLYHKTGYSRAKISVYLKNLAEFDVIDKAVSVETGGWENTQKGLYEIRDTFVNYWFRFIYPNLSDLYELTAEEFYDLHIGPFIDEYVQRYFVDMCREVLELQSAKGVLPIKINRIGKWIGKNNELDIVALDDARNSIVGICSYGDNKKLIDSINSLEKTFVEARISPVKIYVFSANGFDQTVEELASANSIIELVEM